MSDGFLYLSSYGFGDRLDVLRPHRAGSKAALIFNSRDVWPETRLRGFDRESEPLRSLGWQVEELDLRTYFDHPAAIRDTLAELDLVWAVGGNSFVLAQAMDRSGFRAAIPAEIKRGLIYGGYSAGACVAGPDLQGIDLMDDPNVFPAGYDPAWTPVTLGVFEERIVPHWGALEGEGPLARQAATWLQAADLPFRVLRDGDVIVAGLAIS